MEGAQGLPVALLELFSTEIKTGAAGVLEVTLHGRIAAAELFNLVERCRVTHQARRECWDFSDAELELGSQDALRGARRLKELERLDTPRGVALIYGGEESEILCRTYTEFVRIERPGTIMRVFATRAEAFAWLLEKLPMSPAWRSSAVRTRSNAGPLK